MEGFYFWHAMRLFVCPLREIAQILILTLKPLDIYNAELILYK